ncbi:hypothetical protein ZIOFF_006091 [Zingiber officinale]|uniref:Uncharacterized protein n=1 Tax=Zingiber officinale TaxID=94328 RepID=A0A8J5HPB5_ZINOF|nr:hypothetical protein ZIOFF_006091 [Zingiber officinale]
MNLASNLNTDALVGIPTLRTLSFKNNSFGGAIPFLTKFAGLRSVYLSINRFSGGVPDGLYFSRYQFSGLISSSLACSARFLKLRIDDNQFDGRIPNFWQPGLWRSPGFIAGIILICIAVSLAAIGSSFIFRRSQKQHTDAGGALPTTQAAKIELVPANREEHASGRSGKKVPKEEQDQLAFVKEGKVKFNIQPVKFRLSLRHHADCKRMQCLEALHHLDEKEKKNCFPTVQIITTLIHGAGLAKNPHHARKLFDEMGERGLTPDRAAYNALVGAFVRADDLKSLLVIMDKMEKLDECERKKFQFKGSTIDKKLEVSEDVDMELEGNITDELHFLTSVEDELEVFDLRIIHRRNRTGFEENKANDVKAHDLHTGMDASLKIKKNDKDFLVQSLDEIKLLKFMSKYDPADDHLLHLYDYFYYQEQPIA